MTARFGVAGNSETFTATVSRSSADAPAWLDASAWTGMSTSAAEASG